MEPPPDNTPPSADLELARGVRVPSSAVSVEFGPSQGPGGQNVNRRSTRAILRAQTGGLGLSAPAANRLRKLAGSKLTDDDVILITGDEHRSQAANKQACYERLAGMIRQARTPPKKRKPTKPTRGSIERRLEAKKRKSSIKKNRKWKPDA